jgi:glycosyltransferase involved in cell wall biosynthesis
MSLRPQDITIAVTVFDRRRFLKQAIGSALKQTRPVRVIVVEDCGPDVEMEAYVRSEFGGAVEYIRNSTRRGIFGNLNACIEYCPTPWLSILHDDDYLDPRFVEAMVELSGHCDQAGLYFGHTEIVDAQGQRLSQQTLPPPAAPWREVPLEDMVWITPFPFPGQLIPVAPAGALGGFRETSQYCGDWELWARLTAQHGAAQTSTTVAYNRGHEGPERGSSLIYRTGKLFPLTFVQRKRIIAMIRQRGGVIKFERRSDLQRAPLPTRMLVKHAADMRPLLLAYNLRLLRLSRAPHLGYAAFQFAAACLGKRFVLACSRLWNWGLK